MAGTIRAQGRELRIEEIEDAEIPDLDTAVREFTAAEVALMEEDGGFEISLPGAVTNIDADHGKVVFQFGKGQDLFKGVMQDYTGASDKVYLYNREGYAYLVRRDWVKHYLGKVDAQGQIFFARPPKAYEKPTIACKRSDCSKKFHTLVSRNKHFQFRHNADWQEEQLARGQATDDRLLAVLEAVAAGQGVTKSEAEQVLAEIQRKPDTAMLPNDTWSKREVIAWMKSEGWQLNEATVRMNRDELLSFIGLDEVVLTDMPAAEVA